MYMKKQRQTVMSYANWLAKTKWDYSLLLLIDMMLNLNKTINNDRFRRLFKEP